MVGLFFATVEELFDFFRTLVEIVVEYSSDLLAGLLTSFDRHDGVPAILVFLPLVDSLLRVRIVNLVPEEAANFLFFRPKVVGNIVQKCRASEVEKRSLQNRMDVGKRVLAKVALDHLAK